jgi:DNA polymerase
MAATVPDTRSLTALREAAAACRACPLWRTGTQVVFGEGLKRADLMLKWEAKGKRRIHAKPSSSEQSARKPWLEAELAAVRPEVLVCLGATAAQALLGRQFRVTRQRGVDVASPLAPHVVATIHPSAILRAHGGDRARELAAFVDDLRVAASLLPA